MFLKAKKLGAAIAVVAMAATSAGAEISGDNGSAGFSIFGNNSGSGFSIFGNNSGSGFSIFSDNHGSGFGIYPSDVEKGGFSIFGNNHGSGFSIFGNNSGSGFSIFGNNSGSGFGVSGLVCLGIDAGGNCIGWGVQRQAPPTPPTPPAGPGPNAVVAIHCNFPSGGDNILMLAETVVDCETAGGQVSPQIKAAHEAAQASTGSN